MFRVNQIVNNVPIVPFDFFIFNRKTGVVVDVTDTSVTVCWFESGIEEELSFDEVVLCDEHYDNKNDNNNDNNPLPT